MNGRLAVPGCQEHPIDKVSSKFAKHDDDPRSLPIKAEISCEVRDLWLCLCPGNEVAIGHAVAYYAWAADVLSAEI